MGDSRRHFAESQKVGGRHRQLPTNDGLVDEWASVNAIAAELQAFAAKLAIVGCAIPEQTSIQAQLVRTLIAARHDRAKSFPGTLFGEPGWDMLLDLTAATIERWLISVSSLCIASGAPTSTALRCIRSMVDDGIIERRDDPDDARRSFLVLTPESFDRMIAFLNRARDRLLAANQAH